MRVRARGGGRGRGAGAGGGGGGAPSTANTARADACLCVARRVFALCVHSSGTGGCNKNQPTTFSSFDTPVNNVG